MPLKVASFSVPSACFAHPNVSLIRFNICQNLVFLYVLQGIVGVDLKSNSYSVIRGISDESKLREFAK